MLVGLALLAGCEGPGGGVTWLPDSSGFVVTGPGASGLEPEHKGRHAKGYSLHLFDVVSKTNMTVLADSGTCTVCPAVSPDGKLIALGRLEVYAHKPAMLHLIFVDRKGNEQKRSPPFLVCPTPDSVGPDGEPVDTRPALGSTWLVWETAHDKLIVAGKEFGTAIYDPVTNQLRRLGGVAPGVYGGTAVPPDGRGLLTLTLSGEETVRMNLVEWDGTRHAIVLDLPVNRPKMSIQPPVPNKQFPSRWEASTAVVTGPRGTFRIDTALRVATFEPSAQEEMRGGRKKLVRQHEFPDTLNLLRLYSERTHSIDGGTKKPTIWVAVELFDPRLNQTHTVLPKISPLLDVDVAPNGRLVALRAESQIRVVDSRGQVVADFNLNKGQ
jgi:hypothetical protein